VVVVLDAELDMGDDVLVRRGGGTGGGGFERACLEPSVSVASAI
jgi:hypothetical protein